MVSGEVPAGTSVLGVDIGGTSTQQAADTLERELGDEAAAPIPVAAGETQAQVQPQESGLAIDWLATAEQSSGIILNPVALLAHLRGEVEVDPVTTLDEPALQASLEQVAEDVALDPVEPRIRYNERNLARLVPGIPGVQLDVEESTDLVAEAYPQPTPQLVELAIIEPSPEIPAEEAERVLTEFAEPAAALPVTLAVAGREVPVSRGDISATLRFTPQDQTLEPRLNAKKLHTRLADDLASVERAGRDARIVIRDDRPRIIRSQAGRRVAPKDLGPAVLAVLPETTEQARTASVDVVKSKAQFSTADAKALNIKEKLSSYFQGFVPATYRYVNVGEAARRINGTILEPGDTFSMNETAKERTPANGYMEGFIISGGRFREELGGGVSIITTAMWNAGFYAGLERVEQHPHGLYISRYPAGLEATVAWGFLDLKMRNETGNGVLITATRFNDGVRIEMWGTKKWDSVTASFSPRTNYTDFETIYDPDGGDRCVPSTGSRGFDISVTRRRINDGQSESTETFYTTYKPTPEVICGPEPG